VGDRVASSGVFLIAAEARISTAAKYWDHEPPASDSSATAAPPEPEKPTPKPAPAPRPRTPRASASAPPAPAAVVYTCPMHPEVQQSGPGKCPKCGMDLVPMSGGAKP